MATHFASRPENRLERSNFSGPGGATSTAVCKFWLAGRCNRNPCRFLHQDVPSSTPLSPRISNPKALVWKREGTGSGVGCNASNATQKSTVGQNSPQKVCKFWVDGNCVNGDQCRFLHKWFRGDDLSLLAKLQGHEKTVTGIAMAEGCNKLYSAGTDGTVRVWDCQTGQCANVFNVGGQAGSLISEGPWVFVGLPNVVKAWNTQTNGEFDLAGPVGQVYTMVVGNEMLFAGAQDGAISAWKGCSLANRPVPATLKRHNGAVLCLTLGGNRLYSSSMDHSIGVWDIDTLQCVLVLNGHSDAVMSLVCWDRFLISCSLDCTIKIWVASEGGNMEETYSRTEEDGLLALSGTTDAENKPILLCSCSDSSVRLYELPSFAEKGRLFAKEEVRTLEVGPGGLFFSGDATGLLSVWKWMEPGFKAASS